MPLSPGILSPELLLLRAGDTSTWTSCTHLRLLVTRTDLEPHLTNLLCRFLFLLFALRITQNHRVHTRSHPHPSHTTCTSQQSPTETLKFQKTFTNQASFLLQLWSSPASAYTTNTVSELHPLSPTSSHPGPPAPAYH